MLAKRVFPVALLTILATSSPVERDTKDSAPLLTAISNDPDLSIFYSLINSTGGASGIPGPQFEERFNNLTDGRKYTAFAPVNSAFKNLLQELSTALTAPASYPLLEFILRSHIVQGSITTEDVKTSGKSVTAIEGTPLSFSSAGETVSVNKQANLVSTSRTEVGNGAIFKITSVLDSFAGLFGADDFNKAASASYPASQNEGSIASALASQKDLSTYVELLNATSPDFAYLLDGSLGQGKNLSIFAPSNEALQALGQSVKALQPSNNALSSYLLKYPFIDTTSTGQEKSIVGFPATVERDNKGAITSVNNAAVKGEAYCVSGACVYTVDKWLDPIFAGAGAGNSSASSGGPALVEHSGSNPNSHCC
ncbi:FAS1 domain-containing protein [Alternaria rosae]|uniref:FAS1 domain-containing protein n=1 Tax=Alternaria rosae TaxID=1187941 RepID=UPI001E8EF049|nr:FAS1 domain-containing protein [Alternaria rosae]KAH6882973.1 FAS1 domain-containing protein [Alternaria rosae]